MPGNEHRHLRHDPIGEGVGRREVGHVLDGVDDRTGVFDLGATVAAITNVGLQGCDPEAHLVIEEEIDLVWKQVPVVHGVSGGTYGAVKGVVSGSRPVFPVRFVTPLGIAGGGGSLPPRATSFNGRGSP